MQTLRNTALVLLATCSFARATEPKTIKVNSDGSADYKTVQAAIDSIPPNNNKTPTTIELAPATYMERVTVPKDKPFLTLRGTDAKTTILPGTETRIAKRTAGKSALAAATARRLPRRTSRPSISPSRMPPATRAKRSRCRQRTTGRSIATAGRSAGVPVLVRCSRSVRRNGASPAPAGVRHAGAQRRGNPRTRLVASPKQAN